MKKEEIFKMIDAQDWKNQEEQISRDDLTVKTLYLSKNQNVLFGFYGINDREVHFIKIGSTLEPSVMKDLFLF